MTTPAFAGTLSILSPDLTNYGNPPFALVGRGKVNEYSWDHPPLGKLHGRGLHLRCGPASRASTFIYEATGALRYQDKDPALQLMKVDASGGQDHSKEGQPINLHATLEHPEWSQSWCLNPTDGTIGPLHPANPVCAQLCLGIDPEGDNGEIIMVLRTDETRRLIFGGTLMEQIQTHALQLAQAFPPTLPDTDSIILLIKAPPMPWLGLGQTAIVQKGGLTEYEMEGEHSGLHGKYGALCLGKAIDAAEWYVDGTPSRMVLRLQSDRRVALDYAYGTQKSAVGQHVNSHGTLEKKEWVPRSVFGTDGTIGPVDGNNPEAKKLCLGYHRSKDGETTIQLVQRTDHQHRLIFGSSTDMEDYLEELMNERARVAKAQEDLKQDAYAKCSNEMKEQLRTDGFVKIEQGIPLDVVRQARKEINREIGLSSTSTDSFKAKTFASHPAITNLIKHSMAPHIASVLLGGDANTYRRQIHAGQLALRFPGDMCEDGTADCSRSTFNNVSKGWHIDGCASDFIPGVTDHYGTIHNFNMLIGCLLSDIPEPMSGELCCYPGSHNKLASFFQQTGNLDKVRTNGGKALPTGEKTDGLFDRPVYHGTGKAGDLFIANYLTAHFIAPNTAPDIRYAVYFRVSGPRFHGGKKKDGTRIDSLLNPWGDWQGMDKATKSGGKSKEQQPQAPVVHSLTHAELLNQHQMNQHLLSADYSHTQKQTETQTQKKGL